MREATGTKAGTPVRLVHKSTLRNWASVRQAAERFSDSTWLFRGQDRSEWLLSTSIEREFGPLEVLHEQHLLTHFLRRAPGWLPAHLIPGDFDAAAWLGLMQHYGGPTRLLDVTRSPYVALFFAFEAPGNHSRAMWGIDSVSCMLSCAEVISKAFDVDRMKAVHWLAYNQSEVVSALTLGPRSDQDKPLVRPFRAVFPVEPWRPDARQIAQQALFLCVGDGRLGFMDNLCGLPRRAGWQAVQKFVIPGSLRAEVLDNLAMMNISAATLFPDLGGLARSLRTLRLRTPHSPRRRKATS